MTVFRFRDRVIMPTEMRRGYPDGKLFPINYVSPSSSGTLGWSGGTGYNDTGGSSGSCSGLVTFEAALQFAYAAGGRLPTIDELIGNACAGTGCSYDSVNCWTCEKGLSAEHHYIALGKDGDGPIDAVLNSSTAYVRMVADDDIDRTDPVVLYDSVIFHFLAGL